MKRKIEIKASNDGSHTLFLPDMNETYHSIHGAINESNHVFLKMGLHAIEKETITILEVGFGTGLNAFLTALEAVKIQKKAHYYTIEPYPIEAEIYTALNYASIVAPDQDSMFQKLHTCSWENEHEINPYFTFEKHLIKLEEITLSSDVDLIYFDAFAPNKQPELWEVHVLKKCHQALKDDGILVTYCSQGQFKRNLKAAGFDVQKLTGPPGKREMTKGIKIC